MSRPPVTRTSALPVQSGKPGQGLVKEVVQNYFPLAPRPISWPLLRFAPKWRFAREWGSGAIDPLSFY